MALVTDFGDLNLDAPHDANPKTNSYDSLRKQFVTSWGNIDFTSETVLGHKYNERIKIAQSMERRRAMWRDMTDKNFTQRVSAFTPEAVQTYGQDIYHIISNPHASDTDVAGSAAVMNAAAPWVSSRNSFGGQGGALQAAYGYARATKQYEAVRFLDSLQQMPEQDQGIILNALRNPKAYTKLISYNPNDALAAGEKYIETISNDDPRYLTPSGQFDHERALQDGIDQYDAEFMQHDVTPQQWQEAWGSLERVVPGLTLSADKDAQGNLVGAKFTSSNDLAGVDQKVALAQLFQMGNDGFFHTGLEDTTTGFESFAQDPVKTTQQVAGDLAKNTVVRPGMIAVQAIAVPFAKAMAALRKGMDLATTTGEALAFIADERMGGDQTWDEFKAQQDRQLNEIGTRGAYNIQGVTNDLLGKVPGLDPAPQQSFADFQDAQAQTAGFAIATSPLTIFDSITRSIARPVVSTVMDSSDPDYENAVEVVNALTQIFLLKKGGEFARGIKTGETFLPPELVDGQIKAGAGARELGITKAIEADSLGAGIKAERFGGSILGRVPGRLGEILNSPLAHPSRVLDYTAKYAGFKMTADPLEVAMVKNPAMVTYFDKVAWVRQNIAESEQLGYLTDHFGVKVPTELHQLLLDSPRSEMGAAFVDHIRNTGRRVETIKALSEDVSRLKKRQAEEDTIAANYDKLSGLLNSKEVVVGRPGDVIDAAGMEPGVRSLKDLPGTVISPEHTTMVQVLTTLLKHHIENNLDIGTPAQQLEFLTRLDALEQAAANGTAKWSDLEALSNNAERLGVEPQQILDMVNHPDVNLGESLPPKSPVEGPLDIPSEAFLSERAAKRETLDLTRGLHNGSIERVPGRDQVFRSVSGKTHDWVGTKYWKADADGNVVSVRTVNSSTDGSVLAETTEAAAGRGHASELIDQHWEDAGITSINDVAAIKELIDANQYSDGGMALNRSKLRRLRDESHIPQQELDMLKLERIVAEQQRSLVLGELKDQVPVFEYPRTTKYRARTFAPISKSEHFWHTVQKPLGKLPRFFADEMPQYPRLYNPTSADKPVNWSQHNADIMTNWLNRAGVPEPVIRRLIGEMHALGDGTRSPLDFYEWSKSLMDTIGQHLPEDTPPQLRTALTRWSDTPIESKPYARTQSLRTRSDGSSGHEGEFVVGKVNPRDPYGTQVPLPSRPSEFIGHLQLPDVNLATDATSWMRRTARSNKAFKWGFYKPAQSAMHFATAVWKAPILALRFPAVIMRIQMEQMLRSRLYGDYRALTFSPGGVPMNYGMVDYMLNELGGWADGGSLGDPRYKGFTPPGEVDLGSLYHQLLGNHDSEYASVERTVQYRTGTVTPKHYVFHGWAEEVHQIRTDWFDRTFVQNGLDVEATLRDIESGKIDAGYIDNAQLPILREAWGDLPREELLRKWLERKKESIEAVTNKDPELLQGIASGRAGGRFDVPVETHLPDGKPLAEHVTDLNSRINSIRTNLKSLHERRAELTDVEFYTMRVLQQELFSAKHELTGLMKDYADGIERSGGGFKMDSIDSTRDYLRRRWETGELEMPAELRIKRHHSPEETTSASRYARNVRAAWDGAWYSLYRPMSWADIRFTRGSVYLQAAERRFGALKDQGYPTSVARAYAQMEAATMTRDLMYDLSARTSAQRAVKDLMWFAPATQEILNTWLFKIPRQYGNIFGGGALLVGKAHAWMNLMKGLGIIQEDAQGKDVIVVPGMAALINNGAFGLKLPGVKVPDTVYTNPAGFNLVLSNPLPGLSILPSYALGKAAREFGGPFKDISRWMESTGLMFSEDTVAIPRQVSYFWEAVTGHKFPGEFLSPEYAKARYDRSFDTAIQYAYGDLVNQGVKPPRIEDFADTTDELTGEASLSPEAEAKYQDAVAGYTTRLMGDAQDYFRGMSMVGFIGSSMAPSSLYTTDSDKQEFTKFWNGVLSQNPDGEQLNTVQQNMLQDYLEQHPGSLAFKTWYTAYTGKEGKALSTTNPGTSDDWFQDFYDGQKEYLSAEDYLVKLQSTESYRYYAGQLDSALKDIAGPELDPVALLTNGYERQNALNTFAYQWDRYLSLNKEADAAMAANRLAWSEETGTPIKTYEAERLGNTMRTLRQLAPFFSTEGGNREGDYKTIMGQLTGYYSENGDFGTPNTDTEKAMDWYFTTVFQPWADKVFPLYDQARTLGEGAQDASALYDQIRVINSQASAADRTHNGQQYPTPEEMLFGNKSPEEQNMAKYSWATKPTTWLTDFQLEHVGYTPFDGREEMLNRERDLETQYHDYLTSHDISTNSLAGEAALRSYTRYANQIAGEYGTEGQNFWALSTGSPAARLQLTGFAAGSPGWAWAVHEAQYISDGLEKRGYSPKGFSETALEAKTWYYNQIAGLMQSDPTFASAMEDLSYAIPEKGDTQRLGASLWEAAFFGNFSSQYIPQDLAAIGGGY